MKFAFVITNLRGGGAEKAVSKIAAGLAQRGHQVHLILLEHLLEQSPPAAVHLTALTAPDQPLSKGWLGMRWAAWRLRHRLRQLSIDTPFDLLVSTLPFADEVTLRANWPRHWCRIANTLSVEVQRLAARHPAKAERRLHRYRRLYGSRPLIAVSDGVVSDLRSGLGLGNHPIQRIYNPFHFATIREMAKQPAPGRPAGGYVLHVGRFTPQKRHDLLLAAWSRLVTDRALLLLTAPHPDLEAMIAAAGLGERVRVVGFQANPYPWMAGADLLVLCSDHEGMPNVLVESLLCGTPVLSTDVPSGPREILGATLPQCLVPHGDAPTLALAMERLLRTPPDPATVDLAPFAAATTLAAYERLAEARP
ncbi:MAG: glycosyltransferase [Magnetococcus sp. XQGC-1]